jgi:hypothetical protein
MEKPTQEQLKEEELNRKTTYKLMNQPYPQMDWQITLSQNDFPWYSIKFSYFTARECYEKYISMVKDQETFAKKVL